MPQVYGRRRQARLDVSSIFTESPSPHKTTQNHTPATKEQLLEEAEEKHWEDDDLIEITDQLKSVRIGDESSERKRARSALIDCDSNVRRSPRLAQKYGHEVFVDSQSVPWSGVSKPSSPLTFSYSPPPNPQKQAPATSPLFHEREYRRSKLKSSEARRAIFNKRTAERRSSLESKRTTLVQEQLQPLLDLCHDNRSRGGPVQFQAWADELDEFFAVSKIAEASYGEVYRLNVRESVANSSRWDESVLKVIALKPASFQRDALSSTQAKRISFMSNVNDVAGEIKLLKRMSSVPGFANFRDCRVLKGPVPKQFVTAWKTFNKDMRKSEFPDPGRRSSYCKEQLWAVIEMEDAGSDLEDKPIQNVDHVWDIFWGTAVALAKGEELAEFEHRDLHLGNICVKWKDGDTTISGPNATKNANPKPQITLIDYNLSRATLSGNKSDYAYLDLEKDPAIFEGDGDADYQYDVYRYMRSAVLCGDPNCQCSTCGSHEHSKNAWHRYHPLTNLVWLHLVLYKLTEQLEEWPSSFQTKRKCHIPKREMAAMVAKEEDILRLWDALDLENMKEKWSTTGDGSASGLVRWAIATGLLTEEDVLGSGSSEDGGSSVSTLEAEIAKSVL